MQAFEERFWSKVDIRDENECWPWLGAKNGGGYGSIKRDGKQVDAHRVSLELKLGRPLQPFMEACHEPWCHNRECVRSGNFRDKRAAGTDACGERNGNARYTDAQVAKVFELRRVERLSIYAIAEKVGMSRSNVSLILSGKTRAVKEAA